MSFTDHAAARRVKGLRGITREVFLEIAFRTSSGDQHECSVKVRTLAEAIRRSEKAVRVAIKDIRAGGLVHTSRRVRQNGTRSCFKFKLMMPFPDHVVLPKKPVKNQKPAVNGTSEPEVNGTALLSESSPLYQSSIGIKKPEATPSKTSGIADVPSSLQEPEPDKSKNPPNSASPPLPHELRKLWEAYAPLDTGLPDGAVWGMFKRLAAITSYDVSAMMVRALQDWDGFVMRTNAKTGPAMPSLPFIVHHRGTLYTMHQYQQAYAAAAKIEGRTRC